MSWEGRVGLDFWTCFILESWRALGRKPSLVCLVGRLWAGWLLRAPTTLVRPSPGPVQELLS